MKKYSPYTFVKWAFTFGLIYVLPFGLYELPNANWNIPKANFIGILGFFPIFDNFTHITENIEPNNIIKNVKRN